MSDDLCRRRQRSRVSINVASPYCFAQSCHLFCILATQPKLHLSSFLFTTRTHLFTAVNPPAPAAAGTAPFPLLSLSRRLCPPPSPAPSCCAILSGNPCTSCTSSSSAISRARSSRRLSLFLSDARPLSRLALSVTRSRRGGDAGRSARSRGACDSRSGGGADGVAAPPCS